MAPETLIVPLGGSSSRATETARRLLGSADPIVFPVARLANGDRRVLRDHAYERVALVGAPPADELGYAFGLLVTLLGWPNKVALVDVGRGEVTSEPLLRYVARAVPFAAGQLAASTLAVSGQWAAIPVVRRAPRVRTPNRELAKLVYLLPVVGVASPVGGSVTHTHGVIRALRAEGVEVEAFTTSPAIAETASRDPEPPCRWRVVDTPRMLKAIAASAAVGADLALVRAAFSAARGADAIYQRHGRFSLVGALLSHLTGRPLFLEYNGSEEFVARHWSSAATFHRRTASCEDAVLKAAARIIVVSEVDRRALVGRGIEPERIIVNPNGVDAERFAVGGGPKVRRRHGIDGGQIVIGFVGSFGPWHGAPVLARAFASFAARLRRVHLLLVGDGRELDATIGVLHDAGLEARATVAGEVAPDEIPAYLDACDILVASHVPLPAGVAFFGSPTKLFEYMAAGKAIVASRLGQIGDVLEDRVTAWLVEPGDVEMLAAAVEALAQMPEIRRELGANARRQAVAHHSWQLNVRRVLEAYTSLAAGAV